MAGIRISHPTARNVRFTVVERDRPYPSPFACTPPEFGGCGLTHLFKTHHLNVDETGAAIVEAVLFERIRNHLVANGFVWSNEVIKPPATGIGLAPALAGTGAWGNIPIVHGEG